MLRVTLVAIGLCVLQGAGAEEQALSPETYYSELHRARELFEAKQYERALPLLEKLTEYYSDDSSTWLTAAISANATGDAERALDAARRANQLGVANERYNWFEIAKLDAKRGRQDLALDSLERALEKRFTPRTRIRDEPAFSAFATDARFRRIAGLLPEHDFSRDEGWRYDLAFLTEEARRLHASPRREAFSTEFANAARALSDRIPQLSDGQIRVGMQALLTLLRDGHTGVDIDYRAQRLPIRLYFFPEGVFVIDASEEHQALIGSRITRIGTRSIEQLVAALPPYVPRDNREGLKWRGPHTLVHMDFLRALGAVRTATAATVAIESSSGVQRTLDLTAIPASDAELRSLYTSRPTTAQTPIYLQRLATPYWTQRLTPRTLYFQFNGVWEMREQSIKEFAAQLHHELDEPATRDLIVDVRHNPGGDLGLYAPILQAISAFRINDDDHEIYCITGRNTFSAAQAFIGDLERLVNPVFVGEPSSSSPNFVGESTGWIELPYSGTRVSISERHHQHAALPDDGRSWIAPQLPVTLGSTDYFSNQDPALKAVLRVIEDGK